MAEVDGHQEIMMASKDTQTDKRRACLEKTEGTNFEANRDRAEPSGSPTEQAAVQTIGGPATCHDVQEFTEEQDQGQFPKRRP